MDILLLTTAFPSLHNDVTIAEAQMRQTAGKPPLLSGLDSDVATDVEMAYIKYLIAENNVEMAANRADTLVYSDHAHQLPPLYNAWLWLVKLSVFSNERAWALALGCAENALRPMAELTGKKNEDFLALLATTLYGLAFIHHSIGDNNRAAKELTKSQKFLERLTKKNEPRFSAMLLRTVQASTEIITSRTRQMNILAHYQATSELYANQLVEKGDRNRTREAMTMLVDSLEKEGQIMLQMGDSRNAVRYYTKALRYQKKLNDKMGERELTLSIGLARALLRLSNRRAAAEQLLNSLLPLAHRLGASAHIIEIENLLAARNRNASIMSILKSIF